MASALYPSFKQSLLDQNPAIDFDTDTIMVALVADEDYTYNAAHDFMDDVTAYSGTTDQEITPKDMTDGEFDSSGSPTFSSVSQDAAKDIDALVIYIDKGGAASANPVIAYIDLTTPVTPNGGDISITWDASPSYIFAL